MLDLKRLSHASLLLALLSCVKVAMSILTRTSIATLFGAGASTDAYFAAFTIPQQVGDFFFGGIFFALIIPIFNKRRTESGPGAAEEEMSAILSLSLLGLLLATLLYFLSIPWLIPWLFPGFDSRTMTEAIHLSRMFSPAMVLMGLNLIYISLYHIHRDFMTPVLSSVLYPLISLAALWLCPDSWGIDRLVMGNLLGLGAGLALSLAVISKRFAWRLTWRRDNQMLKGILSAAGPMLVFVASLRFFDLAQRNAVSSLHDTGMFTLLEYSYFIFNFIIMAGVQPLLTTAFPILSEQFMESSTELLFNSFFRILRILLFICAPMTVFFSMQSEELTSLLLGYGKLSQAQAGICAALLLIMTLTAIPVAIDGLLGKVLLAVHRNNAVSLWKALICVISIPLMYLGAARWGIYGIVLSNLSYSLCIASVSMFLLKRHHPDISYSVVLPFAARLAVPCLLMGATIFGIGHILESASVLIRFPAALLGGGIAFVLGALLLRMEELGYILRRIPLVERICRSDGE